MKLFWKIFTRLFFLFIILSIIITYLLFVTRTSEVEKGILKNIETVCNFLSKEIEKDYLESKWPFGLFFDVLQNRKDFIFWWIVDDKRKIYLANKTEFIGYYTYDYIPKLYYKREKNIFLNYKKNYGIFIKPLNLQEKKWSFWVCFSLTEVLEERKKIILLVLVFGLCVLILLGVTLYFTIIHVTKPLEELCKGTAKIKEGEFGHRVKVESKDELEQLSHSFNKMAESLENTTTSIEFLNKEIEKRKRAEYTLKEYTKKIEQINKELDDFTYIVSHDLKEPLRAIEAFSKFIEQDCKDKLDEEGRNYLHRIRVNTDRMKMLIDNLLEISRIERRKNPFEEVDIEELINEVKLRLEYTIKEKNANIVIKKRLPKVFCDRIRLEEVFLNLISNAIKFVENKQPLIEIGCREKGRFYEFYIKDNGPGIEEKYFEKIFDIFQRLGKREKHEGTGAGLTIVKKIVEIHKGRVWVESKVGEGSTFYFTIPKEKRFILEKKKIGEILIDKNIVTEKEIKDALEEQEKHSGGEDDGNPEDYKDFTC